MQLKLLAYLTTATTLVLGSTLTVENVVTMVSTFGSKTAALHEELEAIHAGSSIFDVFALNNKFGGMFNDLDGIKDSLRETPGPASVQECTDVIDAFYQLQPISQASLQAIVNKKPTLDNLPSFGRASAVVTLTLGQLKRVSGEIEDALLALAPEQCQAEAQAVANQFNSAYDACIAAYR